MTDRGDSTSSPESLPGAGGAGNNPQAVDQPAPGNQASTVERVADELRRAVFEGELESGTPLREVAIADSLAVARSTVREALRLLVAEGIATREAHRGVSVAAPDPDSIADVVRARGVLELAGVQAWPTASVEARERLREALDTYLAAVDAGASYQQMNQHHLALHLALVGLTESPRLVAMAESLVAELRVALAQIDRTRRNAHDQAGSHAHLWELLEADDVDGAVQELQHHLADAEVALQEALDHVGVTIVKDMKETKGTKGPLLPDIRGEPARARRP
ncbi:MAG: GntR family transcriptional regulator [Nocardioides sp.]|uniref:GntR family transcriptional regulator n=1 Tax=Nocardioides sp. TaxID=35761 RepID=UPI0039E54D85